MDCVWKSSKYHIIGIFIMNAELSILYTCFHLLINKVYSQF